MMDLLAAPSTAEERARRCRDYLQALEEERRKIQVFQKELPLSLHLVTQAIESYRQQIPVEVFAGGCSVEEEMSSEGAPVLEQFIPLKRSSSSEAGSRQLHDYQHSSNGGHKDEHSSSTSKQREASAEKRPDWLRSVQLWTQQPDPNPLPREEELTFTDMNPRRSSLAVGAKKATGAFLPFQPPKRSPPPPATPTAASAPAVRATSSNSDARGSGGGGGDGEKSGCGGGDEKDGQPQRKTRRSWSEELHRRFLGALQQLGGSDVATPKRIRELMKVDGLTNDEVKSHLQKYRLHSRRPSLTFHANSASPSPQQVVFVGGIWVPPPEYAAVRSPSEGAPSAPPSQVYAPVASVPAPKQQQQHQEVKKPGRSPGGREERCVADDGAAGSESPAASSSSRTATWSAGRRR